MDIEKRNRYILIIVIVLMLISVLVTGIFMALEHKNSEVTTNVKLNQIYTSDYELVSLDGNYFFGMYENKIHAIIDKEGVEIYKTDEGINNASWYQLSDGYY